MVRVELAHITDLHLPTPSVRPRELMSKRILGWLSWRLRRWRAHRPEALQAVMRDIRQRLGQAGDAMLVVSGDLVNISTRAEFVAARRWLEQAGAPSEVVFVPGNHDLYVRDALAAGLPKLTPWMTGGQEQVEDAALPRFPLVRHVRNVAIISLNSAYPAPWREASGLLDAGQLQRLGPVLRDAAAKGFCRVVVVHHPPLRELGAARPRKALKNADALREVLMREGAELVLFGHTHRWGRWRQELSGGGVMHVLSASSASMTTGHGAPAAGWQHITVERRGGEWHIAVERRALAEDGGVQRMEAFVLRA